MSVSLKTAISSTGASFLSFELGATCPHVPLQRTYHHPPPPSSPSSQLWWCKRVGGLGAFVWMRVEHGGEERGDRICFFFWEKVLVVQDAVERPIAEFCWYAAVQLVGLGTTSVKSRKWSELLDVPSQLKNSELKGNRFGISPISCMICAMWSSFLIYRDPEAGSNR